VTLLAEDSDGKIQGLVAWGYAPKNMGLGDENVPEPRGINIAKNSWYEILQRRVYGWIDKIRDTIHPNRCLDPVTLQEWRKTVVDLSKRIWSGKDHIHWYSPEFLVPESEPEEMEKNPLSSVLLGWGAKQSKADGVSTFVLSPVSHKQFYEGLGYDVVAEVECGPSRCVAMRHEA